MHKPGITAATWARHGTNAAWLSVLALGACARAPLVSVDETPEAPATPVVAIEAEPPMRGPRVLGTTEQREALGPKLDGVWAYEREVWDIAGGHARVYQPLHTDIVVGRELEAVAPCMFVAREGDTQVGTYIASRSQWTGGALGGVARQASSEGVLTICEGGEVYELEGEQCTGWRFNTKSVRFDPLPTPCTYDREREILRSGAEDIPVPKSDVMGSRPAGAAQWAPNLASACGRFGEDPGCTSAQLQLLRDTYWEQDDGSCAGSDLQIDVDSLFEGVTLVGPLGCSALPGSGEPLYMPGEGVVARVTATPARPGATSPLVLVFENTSTQTRFLRLPTWDWRIVISEGGEEVELGSCDAFGLGYIGPLTEQAEFRLDAGGSLTLHTTWITVGPVRKGESCEMKALAPKSYKLEVQMDEDDPAATLTATARVEGKRICDPCPDPWR